VAWDHGETRRDEPSLDLIDFGVANTAGGYLDQDFFRARGRNGYFRGIQRLILERQLKVHAGLATGTDLASLTENHGIHLMSHSNRISQQEEQPFGVFHVEGNQGQLKKLRPGLP
jgi:hypothetical protein